MATNASLESKLYDLNSAARTVRNLSKVIQERISGSVPEPSSGGPSEVSRPTAHGTVDETYRSLSDAINTLNTICADFGVSQEPKPSQTATGSIGR